MNVKYLSPYKDDPYGKLRGDKASAYFEVAFDEAKIHETDDGIIVAAYVNQYSGIIRSFKPEEPLEQGLCAVPFYDKEYEIRQKINGNWEGVKHQPSIFEKAFCAYVKANPDIFADGDNGINGKISHIPNGMCAGKTDEQLQELVAQSIDVKPIPLVGLLKPYTPPASFQRRSGGGGYNKGASMDEKLAFVKKELIDSTKDTTMTADTPLSVLVDTFNGEHPEDEAFLSIYWDMLMAIIR